MVELPKGEKLDFRAGGYIQFDVPAYKDLEYKNFEIGDEYRQDWDQFKMFDLVANNDERLLPCLFNGKLSTRR